MLKTFAIDYVRQTINWALSKNDGSNDYFDDEDITLFSFYEHLVERDEVDRYVERYKQLVDEQNRTDEIGFGIIASDNSSSIMNLMSNFINPFEWSCTIRCTLGNRDKMIATIYKLFEDLKGTVQNVVQLENGKLVNVGVIGSGAVKYVRDYDFIGKIYYNVTTPHDQIVALLTNLYSYYTTTSVTKVYVELVGASDTKLQVFEKNATTSQWENKTSQYFSDAVISKKMKIDLSFDDLKVETPFVLSSAEYCTVSFSGSATLCDENVRLGNDLVRFEIKKYKVKGENDYTFSGDYVEIEPIEMPSGNSANSIQNQLRSNYLKSNSHTDSIAISIQYTFVLDMGNDLLKQWFNYARYGENNLTSLGAIQETSITPNIIYQAREIYSSYGNIEIKTFKGKIVDDIDIENTESDVMTLQVSLQVQGDND